MERWVEHYSELCSRYTTVSEAALNAVERLQAMDELDEEPTLEELSSARAARAAGKAPGKDGIPSEVINCTKGTLLRELREVLGGRQSTTRHETCQQCHPLEDQG